MSDTTQDQPYHQELEALNKQVKEISVQSDVMRKEIKRATSLQQIIDLSWKLIDLLDALEQVYQQKDDVWNKIYASYIKRLAT